MNIFRLMNKKSRNIFFISVPIVVIIIMGIKYNLTMDGSTTSNILIGVASSIMGAYLLLVVERYILGNPFDEFSLRLKSLGDISEIGLMRFVKNRSEANTEKIAYNVIKNAKKELKIFGVTCNFITHDTNLKNILIEKSKNIQITILLLNPNTEIFSNRDKSENWAGTLKGKSRVTIQELLKIKNGSDMLKIYVFDDDCHELIISNESYIMVNMYTSKQRGPDNPVLLFTKVNEEIVKTFEGQIDRILSDSTQIIEIKNDNDMNQLFK